MLFSLLAALNPLEHVVATDLFRIFGITVTNQMLMALVAGVLMVLIFPAVFRGADAKPPSGARNFFESILEFLRIEVFRPALKEHTERFVPFLWTLFYFILFCNLLGFIPLAEIIYLLSGGRVHHLGGTATGTMSTTGALAICAFVMIHVSGIVQVYRSLRSGEYGHGHHEEQSSNGSPPFESAQNLEHMRGDALAATLPNDFRALSNPTAHYQDDRPRPHGHAGPATADLHAAGHAASHGMGLVPAALASIPLYLWNFAPHPFKPQAGQPGTMWLMDVPMWLFLLLLEFLGALVKPFALAIRLFANMVAGHTVLAVLAGLIVMAPTVMGQLGIGIPMSFMSLFIRALELFVAFLHAYIFVFLATLFIASAVAPEH
jgi:F0F1-type ATP synthase membrane subunit a